MVALNCSAGSEQRERWARREVSEADLTDLEAGRAEAGNRAQISCVSTQEDSEKKACGQVREGGEALPGPWPGHRGR